MLTLAAMARLRLLAAMLACACALGAPAWGATRHPTRQAASPTTPVPQGFVGVVADQPVWPDPFVNLGAQLDTMVASGVQTIRVVFNWGDMQPYANWKAVPADQQQRFTDIGGVPTDFTSTDQLVAQTTTRRLALLPVILDAPRWDGVHRKGALVRIPRSDRPFAVFAKALVERYGPHGTFWHMGRYPVVTPIRMWQVWNEPNIYPFWPLQPFAARYVALLRAARQAIKSADPGATIVLAGMPNYSWIDLGKIYKVPGARGLFDVVAVHPYTRTPNGVITILRYVRQTMVKAGDARKPMLADEISWPSSVGKTNHDTGFDFATTESGQAHNLAKLMPMLVADRRALGLAGFYYYDWAGLERENKLAFEFSGLFRFSDGGFQAKPAYWVFKRDALAMEGCRAKEASATSCQKSG